MTTAPFVELGFHPTDLRPRDLPKAGAYLGSPADAIEAALAVARAAMVTRMRAEVRGIADPTHAQLLRIADLAWQAVFWQYRKVSAPIMADAYLRAYRSANAGDVPISVIYDLADKHAEKIGDYFHNTSREALAEGFNTLVNRRLPAKAAVDKVLDAYGLTPRQMRTYVSAGQFQVPVSDTMPRSLKAKARAYIDRAFTTRTRKLSRQEEHNIDEQAKQFAWMWLQDKGRLNEKAQKMWITAKDERVCPVCGPLHGKKVAVNERFKTAQGEFWTPGLHPNCRCVVRLLEQKFAKRDAFGVIRKDEWDPKEHPRGGDPKNRGRFSRVAERSKPVVESPVWEQVRERLEERVQEPAREEQELPLDIPTGYLDVPRQRQATGPIDIGTAQPLDIPAPLDVPAAELDIVTEPGLDVAPAQELEAVLTPVQPQGEPDLAPFSPFTLLHPAGLPFYAVVHDITTDDMDFYFDQQRFTSDLDDARRMAGMEREARVQRAYNRATGNGMHGVRVKGVIDDDDVEGFITAEDFYYALDRVSSQAQSHQEWEDLPASQDMMQVTWMDPTGKVVDRNGFISMADIVGQHVMSPQEFVMRILSTTHGHTRENETRLVDQFRFDLSGNYVVTDTDGSVPDSSGKETPVTPIKPY